MKRVEKNNNLYNESIEKINVNDIAFVNYTKNNNVFMGKTLYNKLNEIYYFSWVIGYEMLSVAKKYNIVECDLLYDFSCYVATDFVNSEFYQNNKYSSYDMFYKYIEDKKGIEKMLVEYFKIED